MRFSHQVLAASALATLTSAFPLDKRAAGNSTAKTFTVSQVTPNTEGRKLAGPIALERAIGKYAKVGAKVPQHVQAAASTVRNLLHG